MGPLPSRLPPVDPMKRFASLIALGGLILSLTTAAGCRGGRFLTPPGPLNQQQANAVIHDPFPQNDIGPYEAASRPPDYQQPLPEPVRNRISRDALTN